MALYWERGVSAPGLQGGPTVPARLPVPGAPSVFWGPVQPPGWRQVPSENLLGPAGAPRGRRGIARLEKQKCAVLLEFLNILNRSKN